MLTGAATPFDPARRPEAPAVPERLIHARATTARPGGLRGTCRPSLRRRRVRQCGLLIVLVAVQFTERVTLHCGEPPLRRIGACSFVAFCLLTLAVAVMK